MTEDLSSLPVVLLTGLGCTFRAPDSTTNIELTIDAERRLSPTGAQLYEEFVRHGIFRPDRANKAQSRSCSFFDPRAFGLDYEHADRLICLDDRATCRMITDHAMNVMHGNPFGNTVVFMAVAPGSPTSTFDAQILRITFSVVNLAPVTPPLEQYPAATREKLRISLAHGQQCQHLDAYIDTVCDRNVLARQLDLAKDVLLTYYAMNGALVEVDDDRVETLRTLGFDLQYLHHVIPIDGPAGFVVAERDVNTRSGCYIVTSPAFLS